MKREESILRRTLGDTEELKVTVDDQSISKIKGTVFAQGIAFRISVSRNTSGNTRPKDEEKDPKYKPLYTGTVSVLDPASTKVMLSETAKRRMEEKGKSYNEKDIYASKKVRCDSVDAQEVANNILSKMESLICENKSQLDHAMLKAMTPDQLTLPFAVEQYRFEFLRLTYPKASSEVNNKRAHQLQRILSRFPMIPISELSTRTVNTILKETKASDEAIQLCHLFVEYLLDMRKYVGRNPFVLPSTREANRKNAFRQQELGNAVFGNMFRLLKRELSAINAVIALAASGFSFEDIKSLTWRDIEFVIGYLDYVIVHIRRDYAAISKHDFSRPIISDSALYVRKFYKYLLNSKSAEDLADTKIWPDGVNNQIVNNEIRNLLVRAGFSCVFSAPGRLDEDHTEISARILQTNYQRMLAAKCGLKDDPDTLSFLSGVMYRSSTYTSYESHTSPEAALRLYQILKPLSVEKNLGKKSEVGRKNGKASYEAWPKTNHEAARVTGRIKLKPGQILTFTSEHGAKGIVRIHREGEAAEM